MPEVRDPASAPGAAEARTGVDVERGRPQSAFETSRPGLFAVGDLRSGSVKRVASGVGEGSMCTQAVHRYLDTLAERAAKAPEREAA